MSIHIQHLRLAYPAQEVVTTRALTFEAGKVTALMGVNGAGKSTLLKALAGIDMLGLEVDAANIEVCGKALLHMSRAERAKVIGYLGQREQVAWDVSTERLVGYGTLAHSDWSESQRRQSVEQAMKSTDCWQFRNRRCTQISAGELQRVLIARVIAGAPQIILVDEPTSGLDPKHQLDTLLLLRKLAEKGATVIVALHDLHLAAHYCDNCVLLHKQQIHAHGPAQQILTRAQIETVFEIAWPLTENDPIPTVRA